MERRNLERSSPLHPSMLALFPNGKGHICLPDRRLDVAATIDGDIESPTAVEAGEMGNSSIVNGLLIATDQPLKVARIVMDHLCLV